MDNSPLFNVRIFSFKINSNAYHILFTILILTITNTIINYRLFSELLCKITNFAKYYQYYNINRLSIKTISKYKKIAHRILVEFHLNVKDIKYSHIAYQQSYCQSNSNIDHKYDYVRSLSGLSLYTPVGSGQILSQKPNFGPFIIPPGCSRKIGFWKIEPHHQLKKKSDNLLGE